MTGDTGGFWFFNPDNVELMVKVLDGRPVNGYWWVFYAGLTDVEFTLTVTPTGGGEPVVFTKPPYEPDSEAEYEGVRAVGGGRAAFGQRPRSAASTSTPRSTRAGSAAVKQSRTWVG